MAPGRPPTTIAKLEQVFPNLPMIGILAFQQAPGNSSRWYIARKPGFIYSFLDNNAVTSKSTVLDISARVKSTSEGGLLAMAFHPNFQSNGKVYLFYTGPSTTAALTSHISMFRSFDGGLTISPASEVMLLSLDQASLYHHGGMMGFGLDGYLYLGVGEANVKSNSQNVNSILGKILRIDVDNGSPYGIPPTNPFAFGGGRPEVYAWGIRQPYRGTFDRLTGDLWLGDVGNSSWEEVDKIEMGGNYGWGVREGAHCNNNVPCDPTGLIDPVVEYDHTQGHCVIGGYVYRGSAIPELNGIYVYGDWGTGKISGLFFDENQNPAPRVLIESGLTILSFAEGPDGELYLLEGTKIFKIVPAQAQGGPFLADHLSATGFVDPANPAEPSSCMIPYDVNVPFWSDGAVKERWLSVPDGTAIHIEADDDWTFPIGTVFMKNFHLAGRLIETRLFMRHSDGEWAGYSYEWDDLQTDAQLLSVEKTKDIDGTPWTFPSRDQCLECHSAAAGRALGPETSQMNRLFTYPSTGLTSNQLATFEHIGLFDAALPQPPEQLPLLPSITDTNEPVDARARAYLHANCSHCHRPDAAGGVAADFRFSTPDADMGVCDTVPADGDLGVPGARLLFPGDPSLSIISLRAHAVDMNRMPPIARNVVDIDGTALLDEWILSLTSCPAASLQPIVIDDGEPGTSFVGAWSPSSAPSPFGADSLFAKSAGLTYTFQTTLPQAGDYDVFMWWTQWPSRMSNVPVRITHQMGTTDITVNQLANGGQWNQLGTWTFGNQASIRITSLGPGSTCADAVRFVPLGGPPPETIVILDNAELGATPFASWGISGAPNPFGANSLFSKSPNANFTFQLALPQAGLYDVYLWWTQWPSRLTNVPVEVSHSAGTTPLSVNQMVNGGQWNLIGQWTFGTSATVIIRSPGGGTVCADAVKMVLR